MSQDPPERVVRIEARSDNIVVTRTLTLDKAGDFAARLRRRGWRVMLEPEPREQGEAA